MSRMRPSVLALAAVVALVVGCSVSFASISLRSESPPAHEGLQRSLMSHNSNPDKDRSFTEDLGRNLSALILTAVAASVSIAAGVGGGAFFVPLFSVLLQFTVKGATALSQASITGGALSGVACLLLRRHPLDSNKHLIDFDLALMLTPMLLLGVSMGVLANAIFPNWLITILLIFLLLYITFLAVRKAVTLHRSELQAALTQQKQQQQFARKVAASAPVTVDTERLGLLASAQAEADADAAVDSMLEDATGEACTPDHTDAASSGHDQLAASGRGRGSRDPFKGQELYADPPPPRLAKHLSALRLKVQGPTAAKPQQDFSTPRIDSASNSGSGSLLSRLMRPSMDSTCSGSWSHLPTLGSLGKPSLSGLDDSHSEACGDVELCPSLSLEAGVSRKLRGDDVCPRLSPLTKSSLAASSADDWAADHVMSQRNSLEDRSQPGRSAIPSEFVVSSDQRQQVPCSTGDARESDSEAGLLQASTSAKCLSHGGPAHMPRPSCDRQLVSIDELPSHSLDEEFVRQANSLPVPWVKLGELGVLWGVFLALQLLKSRQQRCKPLYFLLFAAQALTALSSGACFTWQAHKAEQGGHDASLNRLIRASLVALGGGSVAGLLGIGGGMIVGPLMLELGVHPLVSAATSALMVLFSSSMGALAYAFDGALNLQYALIFGGACCAASFVGVLLVARIVNQSGKASIVVMLLACIVGTGALLTAGFGGRNAYHDLSTGNNIGFAPFCR